MGKADDLVGELQKLTQGMDPPQRSDVVIAHQLGLFGELLVVLAKDLDKAQKTIKWLTWVIAVFTVAIAVLTAMLVIDAIRLH